MTAVEPVCAGAAMGVLLIASTLSAQQPPSWSVGRPVSEVGGFAGEGDLTELGGVTLLDDGTIVVGDRAEPFLKLFDPSDGSLVGTLGRYGQGPGEYEYLLGLDWCAPGVLSVEDVDRRVHSYDAEMEWLDTELLTLDAIGGSTGYQRDCNPNGFRIATGWGDIASQIRTGLYRATGPVVLFRDQTPVAALGERLSSERIGGRGGSGPHPLGRATRVALGTDRVYVGDGTAYSIEVFDLEGRPLDPVEWTGPDLDYDDDLVDRLAAAAVEQAPEAARAGLRRRFAELPELEQVPAYDRLLVSDADELWVRQFVRPGAVGEHWMVFDRTGALVGSVDLPRRATLWEVRGDRIVYSILDEVDVPVIRVSPLGR